MFSMVCGTLRSLRIAFCSLLSFAKRSRCFSVLSRPLPPQRRMCLGRMLRMVMAVYPHERFLRHGQMAGNFERVAAVLHHPCGDRVPPDVRRHMAPQDALAGG